MTGETSDVCAAEWCEAPVVHHCARCGRWCCLNHALPFHTATIDRYFCRACVEGGSHAPRATSTFRKTFLKQPRRTPQPMTFLAFCRICDAEVYRLEHITRRTKKVMEQVEMLPSAVWLKHCQTMRGLGGLTAYEHNHRHWQMRTYKGEPNPEASVVKNMTQTAWVSEDSYDPTLQVGDPHGPSVPEHHRMLNVMKMLGAGSGYGLKRLTEEHVAGLRRSWGDAWDNPPDLDRLDSTD
jgi:hypothetical protein